MVQRYAYLHARYRNITDSFSETPYIEQCPPSLLSLSSLKQYGRITIPDHSRSHSDTSDSLAGLPGTPKVNKRRSKICPIYVLVHAYSFPPAILYELTEMELSGSRMRASDSLGLEERILLLHSTYQMHTLHTKILVGI